MQTVNAGLKKDLRVCLVGLRETNYFSLFSSSKFFSLWAGKTKDNNYTWRAQYDGKLYAVFGKNESFLKKKKNQSIFFELK